MSQVLQDVSESPSLLSTQHEAFDLFIPVLVVLDSFFSFHALCCNLTPHFVSLIKTVRYGPPRSCTNSSPVCNEHVMQSHANNPCKQR